MYRYEYMLTDCEKGTGLDEQFVALVKGAPAVGKLGAVALPRFQVNRRPDHVEQRENHKTYVLARLVSTAEEHLNPNKTETKLLIIKLLTIIASF